MNTAVVALGSNIRPKFHIDQACALLSQKFKILVTSQFVVTKPIGYSHQPDFLNGAVLLETELDYQKFYLELKQLEAVLGRKREKNPLGPRTIDLDIIVWNHKIVDQDFYQRDFIKKSVLELLPNLKETNA